VKRFVLSTYAVQAANALAGASLIWLAWLAATEDRFMVVGLDLFFALVNAWLFCVNAAIREQRKPYDRKARNSWRRPD
jgi:hypothetical protein